MSRELELLSEVKQYMQPCTYDTYTNLGNKSRCFNSGVECDDCIFEGGYQTKSNKRLHEIIPIIFED